MVKGLIMFGGIIFWGCVVVMLLACALVIFTEE